MKYAKYLILIFLFISCDKKEEVPVLPLDFERSDLLLQKVYITNIGNSINDTLSIYYKYFAKDSVLWSGWIFNLPPEAIPDTIIAKLLIEFAKDKHTYDLVDSVKKLYPENYDFISKFSLPVSNLLKYFPELDTPKIRTFVLGYNYNVPAHVAYSEQIFYNKKYIGIGLHYMLGTYFSFYHPDIPYYIRRRTEPKYLVINVFHKIAEHLHKKLTAIDFPTLLDEMINAGIRYYILEQLLPNEEMKDIFYYTPEQWQWANENEAVIYKTLLPLLYEQNYIKYRDFVGEGPFSKTFGRQAPARLGLFIGWKIVKNYMENNPEISLKELASYTKKDYQKIFRLSKYKPT